MGGAGGSRTIGAVAGFLDAAASLEPHIPEAS